MFPVSENESTSIMGIRFFKHMSQDIRGNIGEYLSTKDKARLKGVSRDFHGKFEWNSKEKWAKWTYDTIMKPAMMLLDQADKYEGDGNKIMSHICGWPGGAIGFTSIIIALLTSRIAFFAGSKRDEIYNFMYDHNDEEITFKKRF